MIRAFKRWRLNRATERLAELDHLIAYWEPIRQDTETAYDLSHWGQERARLVVRKARLEAELA